MNLSIDAERGVVGSIIRNSTTLPGIRKHLTSDCAEWFSDQKHNILFNAVIAMENTGTPIDPVTVDHEAQRHPDYELIKDAGGVVYIGELAGEIHDTIHVEAHAAIVADTYRKRCIGIVTRQAQANAQNGMQAEETYDLLQRNLGNIFENRTPEYIPADIGSMFANPAPPMEFLFDGIVPLNTLAGLDAAGDSGKGYFIHQLAMSLCIGRALFPSFQPTKPCNVLWLESEEPFDIMHGRTERIADKFGLTKDEEGMITDRLTLYSELSGPLNQKDETGRTVPTSFFNWLRDEVRRVQPGLIVIDPRSHYFAGEENSNTDVAAFMNLLKTLIPEVGGGCTIWMNHHSSKARQTNNGSEMGRGASSGRDAMRCLGNLTCLTDAEVRDAGISNPKLFVKYELSKSNWTAPMDGAIYLRRGAAGKHGGVLEEIDFHAMVDESRAAVSNQLGESLSELIGDNPEGLSVRDITKGKPGEDIRAELKMKHAANRADIEEAFGLAESMGLIRIDIRGKKKIPFQVID